jgi:hypothetical protein
VTGAVEVKVDSAETEGTKGIEGSVHKESSQRVETVAPARQGRGHTVHRGSVLHVNRANGQSVRRGRKENGSRDRAENGQSGSRVRHASRVNGQSVRTAAGVHKGSARHASRVSDPHELSRLPGFQRRQRVQKVQRVQPLKQLLRRRQPFSQRQKSQRLESPPGNQSCHQWRLSCRQQRRLRASRGDSKPCYWHRHVQSTADSIAVA